MKNIKKTVLIVDDNEVNRLILTKILTEDYIILIAENGQEALDILKQNFDSIAAVMLDLMMPIMDGYKFLGIVEKEPQFKNIPIIVMTGDTNNENEINTLKLGAWDFVTKPYNKEIIRFRLKNAIDRSQLSAFERLKYLAEYDTLTEIYNKDKFFKVTRELLDVNPDERFIFIRLDIYRFQLVNSFFGEKEGDRLLKFLAKFVADSALLFRKATYGRMESDVFGICVTFEESIINLLIEQTKDVLKEFNSNYDILPCFGLYIIDDRALSIEAMYNRSALASKKCKGNYMDYFAYYDEKMSLKLASEQEITNDMNAAIASEQFEVYLQPKYDLANNMLAGAEALVRWMHPTKGMISPVKFIPVFERNGFISRLDYYVWDKVCQILSKWKKDGRELLPISVNVSRVNLYNPKLVKLITDLVDSYDIPHEIFQIELTETAYTDNPNAMSEAMAQLQKEGFCILMDDFGSGYSSLNVLKDIAVDVLKIDMRFFSETKIVGRGENIIASVVRMAKWLNMPVIAEGVETKDQIEFLHGIGCEYVQGFYFARPMPVSEYEQIALGKGKFVAKEEKKKSFDTDSLWASNSQMEQFFGSLIQPTIIFEFLNGHLELLRVNNAFYELYGYDAPIREKNPLDVVHGDYRQRVIRAFEEAIASKNTAECEYLRILPRGNTMWIRMKLKYINEVNSKHILFGTLSDITEQKEIDIELQKFRAAITAHENETHTMLVVDDVEMNRAILKEMFAQEYQIQEAENGQQALDLLQKNGVKTDIILLDLMMPVMDGKEFLQKKKTIPEIDGIPVIIITADDSTEQQVDTLSLGANDYIVKPFISEIVKRRVSNVLESSKRFSEILREYNAVSVQANMDPLTGIYNRSIALSLVNGVLDSSKNMQAAMLMLDIDNFKCINDTYGHVCGDEILKSVTQTLRSYFRKSDVIARMGGDEFCVFVPNVPIADTIKGKCKELLAELSKIHIEGKDVTVHCSIGIAMGTGIEDDFNSLYLKADEALYKAKRQGKNQSCFSE
ncbi:MAG: EAL domain-containing protein [Lachnospiraceae bacterium]